MNKVFHVFFKPEACIFSDLSNRPLAILFGRDYLEFKESLEVTSHGTMKSRGGFSPPGQLIMLSSASA